MAGADGDVATTGCGAGSRNYQTVGYLERGDYNPSLELAFRLSELFGVPIEAIFSRNPFRPMSEELYNRLPATGTDGAR